MQGDTIVWSNIQLEQWRERQQEFLADTTSVAHYREIDQRRQHVQPEMIALLHSFLNGTVTLKALNAIFQQKTHGEWNVFGLRGLSGGMFLNKLVKYIPDKEQFTQRLRKWLRVPVVTDLRYAKRRMHAFVRYLDDLIATQQVTRSQLQPSRVPFLLSAWWHLQDSEHWPIFYPIVHAVLSSHIGQNIVSEDPVEDYLLFRQRFLSLAHALNLSHWELEHLCTWYGQKYLVEHSVSRESALALSVKRRNSLFAHEQKEEVAFAASVLTPTVAILDADDNSPKQEQDTSCHTHLQWMLAKIGQKVGCQVWIAINDHSRAWKNERLGDLSIKTLPILVGSAFQRIISRIDVLWLQGDNVVAAYEIEHTTDISTGLLRLYDLGVLFPERDLSLCIVTPTESLKRVQFELSRPLFEGHEMRKRCTLITEETMLRHEEHILRWAGSPSVIEDLAYRVSTEVAWGV